MSVGTVREAGTKFLPQRAVSNAVLSLGFFSTGVGTVMLGAILPAISREWSLRDDQAGLLLSVQFFAASLGSVLPRLNRIRSLTIAFALLTITPYALYVSGSRFAYSFFFLFGLGLGMAMTSTSLLFSDRWGDSRAAKLEWLNFAWSAGATAGPLCFLPFLGRGDFRAIFLLMFWLFLPLLCWVTIFERHDSNARYVRVTMPFNNSRRAVFTAFLLLAMGFVGVEVSLSGWLTTYSHRAGIHDLAGAALGTSIFWLGEMLSRLAFSTRLLARLGRRFVITWGTVGATASAFALIAIPRPFPILVLAGAAGICIGPLYPLAISYLLELTPMAWFFAAGGMGAALFLWLTGIISNHFHSLRYGLIIPCMACLVLISLNATVFRLMRTVTAPVPAGKE